MHIHPCPFTQPFQKIRQHNWIKDKKSGVGSETYTILNNMTMMKHICLLCTVNPKGKIAINIARGRISIVRKTK